MAKSGLLPNWNEIDGEGSTARIAIARKPVFQLNPKLRCLVLEKNISRTQNKIFLEHKIKYF